MEERKYFVKRDWIFNLESMNDKCWCLIYDIREGRISLPFQVAGKTINSEDDLFELMDDAANLCYVAQCRKVTGKEYGRIKDLVTWRVNMRYGACLASGMKESDAARCFSEL